MGRKDNSFMFASESSALTALDFEDIEDVKPGEAIIVELDGTLTKEEW